MARVKRDGSLTIGYKITEGRIDMYRFVFMCIAATLACNVGSAIAIDNTPTGFVYPTGTTQLGGYAGWLAAGDDYFPNLYHLGKDIAADEGDPVYAIDDGDVYDISSGGAWGTGNIALLIRHKLADATEFLAVYGHIHSTLANGDNVVAGQVIGTIGDYNLISVDHLHFGIRPSMETTPPLGRDALPIDEGYHGFVDPIDWITTRNPGTSLFADVFTRNGGATTVGTPNQNSHDGLIYSYGPFLRQDFSGGSFGSCCIMYDPRNGDGNPYATNEAYLLRTGFYDAYKWNQDDPPVFNAQGWVDLYGCPTRDEYHPETGDPDDAIQFFFKHTTPGKGDFHYMYYEADLPQGHRVSWHSAYTTAWITQTPNVQTNVEQGVTYTWSVQYRNTGTTTWFRNKNAYPYDYVELVSCDASGAVVPSFFYADGLGWIDADTPGTMQETSVAPGGTATFTFQGRIADNAPLGPRNIYFRVRHSLAGLIENWGGMHYVTTVFPPIGPAAGLILRNPATGDWWVRASDGSSFAYPTGQSWPPDRWLTAWAIDGNQGYTYTPYVGDPNGDGYDDLIVRRNDAAWYIAWNNANGSFTQQGQPLLGQWGTGDYPGRYFFAFANVDSDNADEMITYDAQNANWYVCQYNPNSLSYDSCALWETWGGGLGAFQPLVGDWNGDARSDICLLALSTGHWWVRLSNGSDFYQPSPTDNWCPYWYGTGYQPLAGDWNGDRKCDIALLDPGAGNWWVRLSNGSGFTQPSPDNWCSYWYGAGYLPFVGDFDDDLDTDIALRDATQGNHWVRLSSGTSFYQPTPDNWCGGWGASSSFQLLVGRFGSGVMGKTSPPAEPEPEPEVLNPLPDPAGPTPEITVTLHPNPASRSLTLTLPMRMESQIIRLFDLSGREALTSVLHPGASTLILDVSKLGTGIYFVRLSHATGFSTQKLIILR